MGRTIRSAALDTLTKRKGLESRAYHQEPLTTTGGYLRYRRPDLDKAGTWFARDLDPTTGKMAQARLAEADDRLPADGRLVMDYAQAVTEATSWVKSRAKERTRVAKGEAAQLKIRTVKDALDYYLKVFKSDRKSKVSQDNAVQCADTQILPELGDILISELTAARITKWKEDLAGRGRRKTGWVRKEGETVEFLPLVPVKKAKDMTPAQLEAATKIAIDRRKSSVNWALALLKSALNCVLAQQLIPADHTPWIPVALFKGVKGVRVRFLTVAEQVRLVNSCPDQDFTLLIKAALFTGARYAELASATVADFDAENASLRVDGKGKDNAVRNVYLSAEAEAFFREVVAGLRGSELLLLRAEVMRTTRKDAAHANGWLKDDAKTPMRQACKAAGIDPLNFHQLRHSYASEMVRRGMPLMMLAQQLGHKDTRMVEKHYGHLAPSAVKDAVRALAPTLGISGPVKVQELGIKKA